MKVYLKTYFSAPYEIKWLRLNLLEAGPYIDNFIICEFNRTHTGRERELIFDQYRDQFTEEELKKIIYIGADISGLTTFSETDGDIIHTNERIMRGYFESQMDLHGDDIVFSVDADEILYRRTYPKVLWKLKLVKAFKLNLHLFIYKLNYLWEKEKFVAPTACRVEYYKGQYPAQWRYNGYPHPGRMGCHFTWALTPEQMVEKISRYSHHHENKHLMDLSIWEQAIEKKVYPPEPDRKFSIKVIDMERNKRMYPHMLFSMMDDFSYLVGN